MNLIRHRDSRLGDARLRPRLRRRRLVKVGEFFVGATVAPHWSLKIPKHRFKFEKNISDLKLGFENLAKTSQICWSPFVWIFSGFKRTTKKKRGAFSNQPSSRGATVMSTLITSRPRSEAGGVSTQNYTKWAIKSINNITINKKLGTFPKV